VQLPMIPAGPSRPGGRQYRGFWIPEITLRAVVPAVHARFTPQPSDVILASFSKSGATWLKALAFSALNRAAHPPSDVDHPLRRSNPHDCVRFLEHEFALAKSVDEINDELEALPSPRLLATHLPRSLLPERVGEVCRIVSTCRDPKDTYSRLLVAVHQGGASVRRRRDGVYVPRGV
jgi:hydroxyjasmonate sulfotransferase